MTKMNYESELCDKSDTSSVCFRAIGHKRHRENTETTFFLGRIRLALDEFGTEVRGLMRSVLAVTDSYCNRHPLSSTLTELDSQRDSRSHENAN